ncbi:MAG: hypothetical protein N2253_04555 [Bacteroidia bacterium]|nr:hypothetical protein [Bacteroidia bacterium]MCX7764150.1 hypothetical protein [Bacteroidia bacterium]MDW8057452.1 leucine-rich repeat domain-containing protein [Bacteroidia bacterium]
MGRWAKVALFLCGWVWAQEETITRLIIYDDLIDRFFQIKEWTSAAFPTSRPDTIHYLRAEGTLPPLSQFPNLQGLYLAQIEDLDLTELVTQLRQHCPKLRILAIEDSDVEDVSPLVELRLQGLLLDDNPITDWSPLRHLRGLQFLSIARTPVENLQWLSNLPSLQGLDLSETKITDLSPLSKMTSLRMLALYRCTAISDVSPLLPLSKLEFLNVSFMNPSVVQPLLQAADRFPNLKVLQAQGVLTDATVLSNIGRLTYLEELTLGQNPTIVSLEFVKNLRRLLYLDVHKCSVRDLSPLAGMPFLVKLSIGKNQITSLAPLTQCPRLRELYCYENPIKDWEKLLEMPALSYVMLSKKDLPPEKLTALRAQLGKKGVKVDAP